MEKQEHLLGEINGRKVTQVEDSDYPALQSEDIADIIMRYLKTNSDSQEGEVTDN